MHRAVFVVLFAILPSACFLADDHCSGDMQTASKTPPLSGAALDAWNNAVCTSLEDDLCSEAIPKGNAMLLCQHTTNVVTNARGTFFALECHYYSDDKSCHTPHKHMPPSIN